MVELERCTADDLGRGRAGKVHRPGRLLAHNQVVCLQNQHWRSHFSRFLSRNSVQLAMHVPVKGANKGLFVLRENLVYQGLLDSGMAHDVVSVVPNLDLSDGRISHQHQV